MMSKDVIDVYLCWRGLYSWHKNSVIWDAIPHFLMRTIWRKLDNFTFKGMELFVVKIVYFLHF